MVNEVPMNVSPTKADQASTKIEEGLVIHTTPALIHTARPDGNIDFLQSTLAGIFGSHFGGRARLALDRGDSSPRCCRHRREVAHVFGDRRAFRSGDSRATGRWCLSVVSAPNGGAARRTRKHRQMVWVGRRGAAAKLGMPASTSESKIKSLKISKHRFKSV
jgi:hypothetical protein